MSWIMPDVNALLNQDKYRQANDEISEGLGLAQILVTGSTRSGVGAEVSTWAIQPMLEELRSMIIEWVTTIYEQASSLNNFRNTPVPAFTPIKLQDFVKTAAVFAQAYREGNMSRTTRDEMMGLDFNSEVELMKDERDIMDKLPLNFPDMPYNTQVAPGKGAIEPPKKGGKPIGSQDTPTNPRQTGVSDPNEKPISRLKQDVPEVPNSVYKSAEVEYMSDEDLVGLIDNIARSRGLVIDLAAIGLNTTPEK